MPYLVRGFNVLKVSIPINKSIAVVTSCNSLDSPRILSVNSGSAGSIFFETNSIVLDKYFLWRDKALNSNTISNKVNCLLIGSTSCKCKILF